MNLAKIARIPKLTKLTLASESILKEYNEPLEFWVFDRQPMSVFMALATADGDMAAMVDIVQDMILDDKGKVILTGKNVLPINTMMEVVTEVVEFLGKGETQTTPK